MTALLRVMTYNVHSCRGSDRRLLPERILAVIQSAAPDVVALQELDVGQNRSQALDQAAFLAEGLRMQFHFAAARACDGGHYGNAVLTRLPIVASHSAALPQLDEVCEPRVAQHVRLDSPLGTLEVFNVHLGLSRQERRLQVGTLVGSDWLRSPTLGDRVVLCGDFNAIPSSYVYRSLSRGLRDAQKGRARPTFPALFPVLRLDHIFVGPGLRVRESRVLKTRLARVASDHRPLVADLEPAGIPLEATPHPE